MDDIDQQTPTEALALDLECLHLLEELILESHMQGSVAEKLLIFVRELAEETEIDLANLLSGNAT